MSAPRFTIEELTGSERTLSLSGRSLPYQRLSYGVEVASKKTRYPGNPVATIQVLGPDWLDSGVSGMWKDRFVGGTIESTGFPYLDPPESVLARDIVRAFYELASSGNTLRVQWGAEVRLGILKRFVPTYLREEDVEWSADFEWSSRDDQEAARATTTPPDDSSEVETRLARSDSAATARPSQANANARARVNVSQRSNREIAGRIFDAIRIVGGAASGSSSAAAAALQTASGDLGTSVESANEGLSDVPYTTATIFDDPVSVMLIEGWRRTYSREQADFAGVALEIALREARRVAPGFLEVVTLTQSTSLRSLSLHYYGNADSWQAIADANGLVGSVAPAGTVIAIPFAVGAA